MKPGIGFISISFPLVASNDTLELKWDGENSNLDPSPHGTEDLAKQVFGLQ